MHGQMFHLDALRPVGACHLVAAVHNLAAGAHPFVAHQQHTLPQIERGELGVHRHRDDRIGAHNVVVLQPCPLWPEKHRNLLPRSDAVARLAHRGLGGQHRFGQIAVARRGGIDIGTVLHRIRQIGRQLRLVQQTPRPRCQRHSRLVGPAIARGDNAHPVQTKVPHRPRGGPDVFAHLRAHQHKERNIAHAAPIHSPVLVEKPPNARRLLFPFPARSAICAASDDKGSTDHGRDRAAAATLPNHPARAGTVAVSRHAGAGAGRPCHRLCAAGAGHPRRRPPVTRRRCAARGDRCA